MPRRSHFVLIEPTSKSAQIDVQNGFGGVGCALIRMLYVGWWVNEIGNGAVGWTLRRSQAAAARAIPANSVAAPRSDDSAESSAKKAPPVVAVLIVYGRVNAMHVVAVTQRPTASESASSSPMIHPSHVSLSFPAASYAHPG